MARQPFIERHALWTDDQRRQAEALKDRVRTEGLRLVRLAWTDAHGCSRAKAVTIPAFLESLAGGYNINVATTTLDSANARTFSSFTRGGGMGLDEMTGSPNITIVPDPATFRVLPWAPGVGWVLCDEYFNSGAPYHFSARHLLRRQLERLQAAGLDYVVGLEIEWYLARVAEDHLTDEHVGDPGSPRPADRDLAGRARLLVPLRVEHGPDAAGPVGARGRRTRRSACRCGRSRTNGGRDRSSARSRRNRR